MAGPTEAGTDARPTIAEATEADRIRRLDRIGAEQSDDFAGHQSMIDGWATAEGTSLFGDTLRDMSLTEARDLMQLASQVATEHERRARAARMVAESAAQVVMSMASDFIPSLTATANTEGPLRRG